MRRNWLRVHRSASLAFMLFVATAIAASPMVAQRPRYAHYVWAKPPAGQAAALMGPRFLGNGSNDHRYTGFYIGSGLAAASVLFSVLWCSDADNACSASRPILLAPVAIAILGGSGALIGGLFPKGRGARKLGS